MQDIPRRTQKNRIEKSNQITYKKILIKRAQTNTYECKSKNKQTKNIYCLFFKYIPNLLILLIANDRHKNVCKIKIHYYFPNNTKN